MAHVSEMTASKALAEYDKMIDLPKAQWVEFGSARANELSTRLKQLAKESLIELDDNGNIKLPCVSKEMPIVDFIAVGTWMDRQFKAKRSGFVPIDQD